MRQGSLVYDPSSERMDIRLGLEDYYDGIHFGTATEVNINGYSPGLKWETIGIW